MAIHKPADLQIDKSSGYNMPYAYRSVTHEGGRIKPVALAVINLCLSEGISYSSQWKIPLKKNY